MGLGLAMLLTLPWLAAPSAVAEEVFDPDEPPVTRYRLLPWLSFGAELEVDQSWRRNLRLDRRRDDRASVTPELSLAWSIEPAETLQGFLNVALARPAVIAADREEVGHNEQEVIVELKEAWVRAGRLAEGFSVQVGRQRFDDERTWLYDEELDAVKARYARAGVTVALSASRTNLVRTTWGGPDERDRTANYILHAIWIPRTDLELEGYVIVRRRGGAEPESPVFAGFRARDELIEDLDYWLDFGYVGGREDTTRIRGFGFDAGMTYEWQTKWKPSVTLGLAFGTGDRNPNDRRDTSFRQTGLHQNESDFGGVTDFKYYGEILDPELSNLAIVTVAFGVRPSDRWSVDLVAHGFVQHHASKTLRGAAIEAEPSGRSRWIGSEIDLVIGIVEILDRIEVKATAGYFFPGAALRWAPGAWGVGVEAQLQF